MSVERHHEHHERNEAAHADLEAAAREKLAELRRHAEAEPDHAEHRAEAAREIINQQEAAPEPPATETEAAPKPAAPRHLLDHKLNYAQTMASLQRQLRPVSRSFSKFIHVPAVEKTSETLERTVARPSILVGATWTAFIVGAVFYFTARHYGYALSGSELLLSFIVGAVLGVGIESLLHAARRR